MVRWTGVWLTGFPSHVVVIDASWKPGWRFRIAAFVPILPVELEARVVDASAFVLSNEVEEPKTLASRHPVMNRSLLYKSSNEFWK